MPQRKSFAETLPFGQHRPVSDLADRAWLAYHSLPRDEKGRPPSRRKVEQSNELPPSVLSKLFTGERKSVDASTLFKLAKAFGVSATWLQTGEGDPPLPTGRVPPRVLMLTYGSTSLDIERLGLTDADAVTALAKVSDEVKRIGKEVDQLKRRPGVSASLQDGLNHLISELIGLSFAVDALVVREEMRDFDTDPEVKKRLLAGLDRFEVVLDDPYFKAMFATSDEDTIEHAKVAWRRVLKRLFPKHM